MVAKIILEQWVCLQRGINDNGSQPLLGAKLESDKMIAQAYYANAGHGSCMLK